MAVSIKRDEHIRLADGRSAALGRGTLQGNG